MTDIWQRAYVQMMRASSSLTMNGSSNPILCGGSGMQKVQDQTKYSQSAAKGQGGRGDHSGGGMEGHGGHSGGHTDPGADPWEHYHNPW